MEKLVGQEIRCRIIKLDVAEEDVVVDRRVVARRGREGRREALLGSEGGRAVHGTVRSLTDYGAFVDIGGVDGLLHVADISWARVNKPADVLTAGRGGGRESAEGGSGEEAPISLGMKQLPPHPWDWPARNIKWANGYTAW